MNWFAIADIALDAIDSLKKIKKEDNKLEAPDMSWMPLIAFGLVAAGALITKLIDSLVSGSGEQYSAGVGSDILDKAVGRKATVTSHFGEDRSFNRTKEQIAAGNTTHKGVDIAGKLGDAIFAPFTGKVIKVNNSTAGAGGRSVTIEDANGTKQVYMCHLSAVNVKVGDTVAEGQRVGAMGASGHGKEQAYKVHLHLQVGMVHNGHVTWVDPERNAEPPASFANVSSTEITTKVSTNISGKNNAGVRNKNPGNDTFYNNPFALGKGAGGSGNDYHSKYESFTKGYAGNAYQLLRYVSGQNKVGLSKNPTLEQVIQKWVGSTKRIALYEKYSGLRRDQRIPLDKNVLYQLLLTIGFLDSSYCNPSEARVGLDMAWREFSKNTSQQVNILNQNRTTISSSVTSNRRVNGAS